MISEEVSKIHGITHQQAEQEGVDLKFVLSVFSEWAALCDDLVGHNLPYDLNIMGAEFVRASKDNPLVGKSLYDTMQKSTNYCKLPGGHPYKWPKLKELYYFLFREELAQTHTALDDIRQPAKCYFELQRLGIK